MCKPAHVLLKLNYIPFHVMAGLVPAIHDFSGRNAVKTWMPATSVGMTARSVSQFERTRFGEAR